LIRKVNVRCAKIPSWTSVYKICASSPVDVRTLKVRIGFVRYDKSAACFLELFHRSFAMAGSSPNSSLVPCLGYKDADAAIEWLCRAFGFAEHAVYRDEAGKVVHAELTFGTGMIMLGPDQGGEFGKIVMTTPERAGGRCTQTIYVIVADVDAHHARASAAGAEIIIAPRGESYGGRSYCARDPEGHAWSFGSYDPWPAADAAATAS
jgi:uncharacterized glyoxalase superfamily protein PhnB